MLDGVSPLASYRRSWCVPDRHFDCSLTCSMGFRVQLAPTKTIVLTYLLPSKIIMEGDMLPHLVCFQMVNVLSILSFNMVLIPFTVIIWMDLDLLLSSCTSHVVFPILPCYQNISFLYFLTNFSFHPTMESVS